MLTIYVMTFLFFRTQISIDEVDLNKSENYIEQIKLVKQKQLERYMAAPSGRMISTFETNVGSVFIKSWSYIL